MKLVIFGSGNVANVLGRRLQEAGHEIRQVVGRNREEVHSLAAVLRASPCSPNDEIQTDADFYLVALSDNALFEFVLPFRPENGIVVHTAGSVPSSVLGNTAAHFGVLYPLQTLNKSDIRVEAIPFLINGNSADTIYRILFLASTISSQTAVVDDEQRAKIHLAAAIVNNFSNHLFALAYDFCKREDLDFSLLAPLITRTAEIATEGDPAERQTGPAKRGDLTTIEKHEQMLGGDAGLRAVYTMMTQSIINHQKSGNSASAGL